MLRKKIATAFISFALLSGCSAARPTATPPQAMKPPSAAAPTAQAARATDATGKTVAAAQALLATLDDAGRAKISFAFDGEQKSQWSNFPVGIYPRNGLRWGDLNAVQRNAALALLATALSPLGLQKVKEIMEGDEVLKKAESGHSGPPGGSPARAGGPPPGFPPGNGPRGDMRGPQFGRDEYYLAFLGTPSLSEPWMIQFGGHHLALNLTMVGKSNVLTPSLPAAQPAHYQLEGQTVRPLGRENDKSFALINALDAAQQKKAILPYQVSDLVLGPGQDGKTIAPEGILAAELNGAQKRLLLDLAHEWVGILNEETAALKMTEIEAHLNETWFAWSGPTTNGSSAYFRIQGPTLLIEYSPQRSRGDSGLDIEHIHTIYRDPTNDYGARLVRH